VTQYEKEREPMKLSQAYEGFWLDKRLSFSKATVENYNGAFGRFLAFAGDKEFCKLGADDVRAFLNHLFHEEELSKRSIHSYWAILSSLWTWAEKEHGLPHVIRERIKAPKYPKRIIEPFTQDEVRRLIEAAEYEKEWTTRTGKVTRSRRATADRERAIVLTLVDTGIRATELCELRVSDFDRTRGRLLIRHGKGDKARHVILGARTKGVVSAYLDTRGEPKPTMPLFAARGEKHLCRENLLNIVKKLGDCAGVVGVHPHRFRHTFAITFLRNGGHILVLKELMGHAKLDMIMTYVTIAAQDLEKSVKCSPVDNWRL
jgi:integrase/recombinase XerD